jgi:hypothetical protein
VRVKARRRYHLARQTRSNRDSAWRQAWELDYQRAYLGAVAQLAERWSEKPSVAGSTPAGTT